MKFMTIALLFLFPGIVAADNSYSGVWEVNSELGLSYVSLHAKDGWIIAAELDPDDDSWIAFEGAVSGNVANVNSIYGTQATYSYELTFTSQESATIVLKSCNPNPGFVCLAPAGTSVQAVKIF
ncbi:MAG: hypothetical protein WD071_13280 [Pseudohongiella sp.]|uniref:hypothetical protein n=1 Tax=Pseudohongiella sp. TaxID=1979412 RepID=UPI0034A07895